MLVEFHDVMLAEFCYISKIALAELHHIILGLLQYNMWEELHYINKILEHYISGITVCYWNYILIH